MQKPLFKEYNKTFVETPGDPFCPSCLLNSMSVFHELNSVPVNSVLNISTREEALTVASGMISLGFCQRCGFIANTAFDPYLIEYSSNCEESQGYSQTFHTFLHGLATDLIEEYDLHNKDILEIGCGKGEFLTLLCELGENRGVGFDPAYVEERSESKGKKQIIFIKDYYSEKYLNYYGDFICCRMTLEHIRDTANLVNIVRRSIGDRTNTIVFFQVPDVTRILCNCAFEDIYYEHCSYFSPGSLARLFRKCGFDILNLKTAYNGQYILLEAKPVVEDKKNRHPLENDIKTLKKYVTNFQKNYQIIIDSWHKKFQEIKRSNEKAVLWGSGSKAVSFLTTLDTSEKIEYVVDINPYRQGTYMAGTGQLIVAPCFLKKYQPDVVIIMNPIYLEEIRQDLVQMGLDPEILILGKGFV